MSAIALHDILEDLDPVTPGRRPRPDSRPQGSRDVGLRGQGPRRRDHLRVVRPGETAVQQKVPEGPLTITRRGRLVITLTVATALVLTAMVASAWLPAAAGGGETIVVQPGQTLSHIAVTELPELPLDRAVMELQLANNLNSLDIQAGTELEIPQP